MVIFVLIIVKGGLFICVDNLGDMVSSSNYGDLASSDYCVNFCRSMFRCTCGGVVVYDDVHEEYLCGHCGLVYDDLGAVVSECTNNGG